MSKLTQDYYSPSFLITLDLKRILTTTFARVEKFFFQN